MELMTSVEMAQQWGISSRRVAILCEDGRVEGAFKKGKTWLIPSDAKKPDDRRRVQFKGQKELQTNNVGYFGYFGYID